MPEKKTSQTWWQRKHEPLGGTDENPSTVTEFAGFRVPLRPVADSDPCGKPYPEQYRPFLGLANLDYGQVYGDMPETKLMADRDRAPLLQVGWMSPFVGTENPFPIAYSK